ncbi:N-acetylglucosamine-6-phosphate deacetylase [Aestuariibacter halophilus]|uniref:N-acetylgalactosamine-6-phosphate deacetylase n=1 Tax=Fluctibacter halophilus TaxID=226011 RepID=A0ABS8GDN3_9ALTE|nr:N-acetylglucosamine-6-phosphate deacetylase [Aestuariibacter halophilus]MCC2617311.1 N-acetylglucosamine-6-phosphate deacetylase [Aestuariibacter halophilus]
MPSAFRVSQLFDGEQFVDDVTLRLDNGCVASITSTTPADAGLPLIQGLLVPGFIDVQVNGGGGILFNAEPTVENLQVMSTAHSRFGTTAMMPTLITDQFDTMTRAADAMASAIDAGQPGILGIHFEGPHLSEQKKGIHRSQFIRPLSDDELALFTRSDLGQVMVTLAPERVSTDDIRTLVSAGVRVCLGHSNADAETTLAALDAGASGFTHLFNAMSPLQSRAPGMIGAALLDNHSYCGLINDHYHVHPLAIQLAIKSKGPDHIMLVTDAMAHVGGNVDELPFFDTHIIRHGDKLTIPEGNLAGSALDMASAVRNTHALGIPLKDCLNMASLTPARYLGQAHKMGKLTPGYRANMVLLDEHFSAQATWIEGRPVWTQTD